MSTRKVGKFKLWEFDITLLFTLMSTRKVGKFKLWEFDITLLVFSWTHHKIKYLEHLGYVFTRFF